MGMRVLAVAVAVAMMLLAGSSAVAEEGRFTSRVVTTGLADPYEITWGPDGFIWATEKSGLRVVRVDPRTGAQRTAVTIPDAVHSDGGQDGVLGMALHPALLKGIGHDHVFVAYTTVERRAKIVRYTYDPHQQVLSSPVDVVAGLPGGTDHQSARLVIGPDSKLYYTIGDQGANQWASVCEPIQAQRLPTAAEVQAKNWDAYRGKVLRLNQDGSIPHDNPLFAGVRSHVYTYGHRNPQGLAFGATGTLYSSEQGPKTDDEVNIISRGGNYGWPHVAGFRDDKAYTYANWSQSKNPACAELTFDDIDVPPSVPQATETSWHSRDFTPPIRTFHTVPTGHDFRDPQCAESEQWYMCWPTVAPASLDVVPRSTTVPGWGNSLLMPVLKEGTVYRLALSPDGRTVTSTEPLWRTTNRYRDVAISPDGRSFYVATDSTGRTRTPSGTPTETLTNPGAILEFRHPR